MKKTFFLLSFVVLLFAAIQTAEAQISLGIGSGSRVYTFQEGNAPAMPGAAPTISIEFEANFRLSRVFGVSVGADLAGVAGYHFMKAKTWAIFTWKPRSGPSCTSRWEAKWTCIFLAAPWPR